MDDYLAAEPLIVARLESQVTGVKVLTAADLAGVKEAAQVTPAVHVLYGGDRLADSVGHGIAQTWAQIWWVVVAVRNARNQGKGREARKAAGPYIAQVFQALTGWQMSSTDHGPLKRVNPPGGPVYSPGGFAYFPLAFETIVQNLGNST